MSGFLGLSEAQMHTSTLFFLALLPKPCVKFHKAHSWWQLPSGTKAAGAAKTA